MTPAISNDHTKPGMASRHPTTIRKLAYSRREAAALLGISCMSLDRLCHRGLLNPSRALRRPLFTEVELLRFLSETQGGLP